MTSLFADGGSVVTHYALGSKRVEEKIYNVVS